MRILIESSFDITEEAGTDDTASAPHKSDGSKVEVPLEGATRFGHKHEALCIAHNL